MAQTTMCDKILTIGTNLQNNLNARGVTCTFGNTNGHTIYDLAQLVNERNLKGIGDTNLKIMASNPYCVSGDTTDIIVLLRDGVGTPITNQEVTVSDGTNEHTLTTDANGKATLYNQTITTDTTYTATYKGKTTSCFIKYVDIMVDYAVIGNKNTHWFIRNSDASELTVTIDTIGTNLSNSSTTSRYYFANPNNFTSEAPPVFVTDFIVECDIVSLNVTGGTSDQIAFLLQGQTQAYNLSHIANRVPCHIKIVKKGTSAKHYVDDTLLRETTISDRTNYYMGFQLYKTCNVTFKNYRIYEI